MLARMIRNLSLGLVLLSSLAVGACGHPHEGEELLGEVVLQDDASDEAFGALADTYEQMGGSPNAAASEWAGPEAGPLAAGTPPTFSWTEGTAARHGVATGRFVWLRITATGDDQPIDVASVDTGTTTGSTTFVPTPGQWARVAARGTLTARLITAELDDARVVLGPYEPADATRAFTIAE